MSCLSALVTIACASSIALAFAVPPARTPEFRVDPFWPKPLPNHWIIGAVAGVAVDRRDHVWITHRPSTLQPNETRSIWKAAPPVLEFDADGTLVSSWGGPGAGYEWPQLEHGIYVDERDNVWLGAGGDKDAHILKFTREGKFLMQIGHQGKGRGSNDTENLGAPAQHGRRRAGQRNLRGRRLRESPRHRLRRDDGRVQATLGRVRQPAGRRVLHARRREAAGTVQRRGAERKPARASTIRTVRRRRSSASFMRCGSRSDGLVYVCDRTNDRLQVFRKDGTFVREVVIAKDTFGSGSVWDVGFSTDPQQSFLFINDGTNQQIYVLDRQTLEVVSTFGGDGHWAGQFYGAHNLAVNSKGDLFITETYEGKRVQKFHYVGAGAVPKTNGR